MGIVNRESNNLRENIGKSIRLLDAGDRRKYTVLTILQAALSIIDLVSVAVVGLIAAIAVNGIGQVGPGDTLDRLLTIAKLENFTIQTQAAVLGLVVGVLLSAKSIFSLFLNKRMLFFLGYRSAKISKVLVSKLVQQNALVIESNSAQKLIYAATTGINSIVIGVLGSLSAFIGDLVLCIILFVGLFVYSPSTTVVTALVLGLILSSLFVYLNKESVKLTSTQTKMGIINAELLSELLENYREAVVRNRRGYYERGISEVRQNLASVSAMQNWLPNISKYTIEVTVTVFTLLLAYLQFSSKDAAGAAGSLAIFLVAGARLAPSLLRIQQYVIAMNAHSTSAGPTFELFERMSNTDPMATKVSSFQYEHDAFVPKVKIQNLEFSYPESDNLLVRISNLEIHEGEFIAIVGPSGAGKSTFVDLILGILEPRSGSVEISDLSPVKAFSHWPGAVGYVSQRSNFPTGTIKSCIAGGYEEDEISDELVWTSLKIASLSDFVKGLPSGLHEYLGEKSTKLSGGERQRLSIARALLTQPKLLVMDEATSSLDSDTEAKVSSAIQELHGKVTLVVVAHRLSTVRMADRILYFEQGQIVAEGTFEELRASVPNFDAQAALMGL